MYEISDNLACQVQLLNWQPYILTGYQHFATLSLHKTFIENLHDRFTVIRLDDVSNLIFGEPRVGVVDEVFHYAQQIPAPSANFEHCGHFIGNIRQLITPNVFGITAATMSSLFWHKNGILRTRIRPRNLPMVYSESFRFSTMTLLNERSCIVGASGAGPWLTFHW